MKIYVKYFIIFLIVIFVLPSICTKGVKVEETKTEENNIEQKEKSKKETTSEYSKIKLYHKDTKKTEELDFDEYLYGTVSAEMPASYEIEALKAQAVVSRTYTIYQIKNNKKHNDADICDDYSCCQAWLSKENRMEKWKESERESNWQKIKEAVDSTSGKIITYNEEPINAFFHSNSGGTTESVSNIWGEKNLPYLQSVETAGEDAYKQYSSEVSLTKKELTSKMKDKYSDFKIDWQDKDCIKILKYTDSKRVKTIKVGNQEIAGTELRSLLGLKSTNFTFKIDGDKIIFSVIGYGHGVGMSQTGADSMAKSGSNFEDIIKHFYTGVEITLLESI